MRPPAAGGAAVLLEGKRRGGEATARGGAGAWWPGGRAVRAGVMGLLVNLLTLVAMEHRSG